MKDKTSRDAFEELLTNAQSASGGTTMVIPKILIAIALQDRKTLIKDLHISCSMLKRISNMHEVAPAVRATILNYYIEFMTTLDCMGESKKPLTTEN